MFFKLRRRFLRQTEVTEEGNKLEKTRKRVLPTSNGFTSRVISAAIYSECLSDLRMKMAGPKIEWLMQLYIHILQDLCIHPQDPPRLDGESASWNQLAAGPGYRQ